MALRPEWDGQSLPVEEGNLEGPLVVVFENDSELVVVQKGAEEWPLAWSQLFDKASGELVAQLRPVGVMLKHIYMAEEVRPALDFTPALRKQAMADYVGWKAATDAAWETMPPGPKGARRGEGDG